MSHRGGHGQAIHVPVAPNEGAAVQALVRGPVRAARPADLTWSWEDPTTLVAALRPARAREVLLAAGAGDDALSLIIAGAARVVAATPHPGRLALAELKLVMARGLSVDHLHAALGLSASGDRLASIRAVAEGGGLSEQAWAWVESCQAELRAGVLGCGPIERAADSLRAELARAFGVRTLARLLSERHAQTRLRRLARVTGGRWRIAFRSTMEGVLPGVAAALLRRRVERAIARGPDFQTLRLLCGRCIDTEDAHPYLTRAGHAALCGRGAGVLELMQTDLVTAMAARPPGSLGAISLGLVEALPVSLSFALDAAAHALRPGGRLLLRTTGVVAPLGHGFAVDLESTRRLLDLDRCLASRSLIVATRL